MPIAYEEADCGILPTINPKRGFRFLSRRFKVGSWSLAALLAISSQNAVLGQAPCNCGPGSQYPGSSQYQSGPYQGSVQYGGGQYGGGQYGVSNQAASQYYSQPGYGQSGQYYGQGPAPNQNYMQAPGQAPGQVRATGPMQAPQVAQPNARASTQGRSAAGVQSSSSDNGSDNTAAANQSQWSGSANGAVSEGYVGPLPSGGNWQGPSSWSANQGVVESQVVDGGAVYRGPMMGGQAYGGTINEGIINGGPVYAGPIGGGYLGGSAYGGGGYGQAVACAPVACAPAPQPLGLYGGFDFLFIRPHFDNNVAIVIDPPSGNTLQTYDYDYEFSPRAYLGWQDQCSGFGFRFGFWNFDADAGPYSATSNAFFEPVFVSVQGASGNLFRAATAEFDAGGGSQTLTAQHELELQVYDFEMTQAFNARGWNFLGGVGIRFADIDQLMYAKATRDGDGLTMAEVSNDLSVEGVGPTASMQVFRPLGNSRFSAFGGLRGSLLLADTNQSIYNGYYGNWDNDAGPDGIPGNGDDVVTPDTYGTLTDRADQREVITNFELQLGVQYQLPITSRCDLVLRSAYETQTWFDVGGPVDSHSTLSFDGISFMAGLMF
ncbi:hypothetical protein Q31b_48270 [Novipirellula aureliae]|uniref:Uncharacterized protein n=1 Tax=Novipirellula aureliae TaxID=2527966 RepID=A0A5C6DNL6_9BACT|nr:hypothetical protein [Novipirellula aureliae]TWU36546.1 hypothetical protein Q31b_48270 [Novipirellula aureliae]